MRETLDGVNARLQKFLMSDAATPCSCARRGGATQRGHGRGCLDWRVREGGHGLTSRERKERGHAPPTSAGERSAASMPPYPPRPPLRRGPPSVQPWRSTSPKTTPKPCAREPRLTRRRQVGRRRGDLRVYGRARYAFAKHAAMASNAIRRRAWWGARVSDASLSECAAQLGSGGQIARDDPPTRSAAAGAEHIGTLYARGRTTRVKTYVRGLLARLSDPQHLAPRSARLVPSLVALSRAETRTSPWPNLPSAPISLPTPTTP